VYRPTAAVRIIPTTAANLRNLASGPIAASREKLCDPIEQSIDEIVSLEAYESVENVHLEIRRFRTARYLFVPANANVEFVR
jgi:hypothetical protein